MFACDILLNLGEKKGVMINFSLRNDDYVIYEQEIEVVGVDHSCGNNR